MLVLRDDEAAAADARVDRHGQTDARVRDDRQSAVAELLLRLSATACWIKVPLAGKRGICRGTAASRAESRCL